MTGQSEPRRGVRGTVVIVVILVVVIAGVIAIGILTSGAPAPAGTTSPPSSAIASSSASSSPTVAPTVSAPPLDTAAPTPSVTAPTPQATRTTTISSAAPIKKELAAEVVKSEAVQGKAQGPGEVAGPSVRFTITITNSTGKSVDLSSTVVNAYYGTQGTPATQLEAPGGKPFPDSVAAGRSVTGVFVFNIPSAQRKTVKVTVDTSVLNPVVAFVGAAPR